MRIYTPLDGTSSLRYTLRQQQTATHVCAEKRGWKSMPIGTRARHCGQFLIVVATIVSLPILAAAAPSGAQRYVIVPSDSQVIYRVGETLFREGNRYNVAVGVTNAVKGEILVDRANPRNSRIGTITVDISTFRTDNPRRDNAIREQWLESARFPIAEFRPTTIQGIPNTYTEGREVTLQVTGDLKIRDVTRQVTFSVTVKLEGDRLTGTAKGMIRMTDFGFDPPSILGILRAENEVEIEFRFVARRG